MRLHRREHRAAAEEFDSALDWYAERSSTVAVAFLDAAESTITRIAEWPNLGRPYRTGTDRIPPIRTARIRGFPYSIVYLVDGDQLVIFAYPHDRQRPGYWRRRLEG